MEIYFECTECKEVEPINITALSANGFGLQCSVCKTYFTFGVVAVEHLRAPDVGDSPAQQALFTPEADTAEGKLPAPAPRR